MSRQNIVPIAVLALFFLFAFHSGILAQGLPLVSGVELQPLAAHAERVVQALELAGVAARRGPTGGAAQRAGGATMRRPLLRRSSGFWIRLCLVGVTINPESRVKVQDGAGAAGADASKAGGCFSSRSTIRPA